ncbi:hypothetical protein [Natrialba asiatica]|uniref:Uncharacterized protein n=1 Tax=Natrialba asiatica (strain ATCC 700177 / DSM 12278 / JCM 9576 / FERM P-10747 / NBRC 102637 / 172P1) TaxID=29540 RepID=M0AS60_NATA1|nr:hypothetical protein [Natrialba asiatica]ELZ00788.1 hypothetical protein C481_11155 [Natrialba asiatica DSM 12278]
MVGADSISIELTDEEMEDVEEIARARNQSYADGRTADTNYTPESGENVHVTGIKAEIALSILYEEAEVDRSVSALGDNGVDAQLRIGNEMLDVDVKATTYDNGWLLIKQGYDHEEADAFVVAVVDGATVEFRGWMRNSAVLRDENLEESPTNGATHSNYTIRDNDRYVRMPEPDIER